MVMSILLLSPFRGDILIPSATATLVSVNLNMQQERIFATKEAMRYVLLPMLKLVGEETVFWLRCAAEQKAKDSRCKILNFVTFYTSLR